MAIWTAPNGDDLWKVICYVVLNKADEGVEGQLEENNNLEDVELASTRRGQIVLETIADFRGAIRQGGKYPLSITTNSVPPEVARHVLNMAAYQLINSTPNLGMVIITEKGASNPFQTFYNEAVKYLEALRTGRSISLPDDPTGQDYETAVADDNPAIKSIYWGDSYASDDEYAAGVREVEGIEIPVAPQDMTTT
jgi:hypothetical protein